MNIIYYRREEIKDRLRQIVNTNTNCGQYTLILARVLEYIERKEWEGRGYYNPLGK